MQRLTLALLLVLLTGCARSTLQRQTIVTHTRDASWDALDIDFQYLLYLPPGHDDPANADRRWPMIVFLHGIGENGGDPARVTVQGLPDEIERGFDLPFVVISPHNSGLFNRLWHTDSLIALVDDAVVRYRADPDRVYLTGVSLGGYATWVTPTVAPDRFAAVVPVAAWGYPGEVGRMRHIPVWAFHGENDFIVNPDHHRAMVDALNAAGGDARWTLVPGRGHGVAKTLYTDPELYDWLLQHRRQPPP